MKKIVDSYEAIPIYAIITISNLYNKLQAKKRLYEKKDTEKL